MRLHFLLSEAHETRKQIPPFLADWTHRQRSEILPRDWAAELAQLTPALKSRLRLSALC
jgi:hypothetical protein